MSDLLRQFRSLTLEQVERLLQARPALLTAKNPTELVTEAARSHRIGEAIAELSLPARQVAEALHLLGHRTSYEEVRALDPDADDVVLRAAVEELRTLLLVTGPDDELVLVRPAEQHLPSPLGFGRPVVQAHESTSYYELVEILRGYGEPRPRSGEEARRALARVLSHTDALAQSLQELPVPILALLQKVDADGPVLRVPGLDLVEGKIPPVPGLPEALDIGLLVSPGPGRVELPYEVGAALRPVRFDLAPVVLPPADEAATAAACAAAVSALLRAVEEVGEQIASRPLPLLASGSLSVKEIRALATAGRDPGTVALVLRLLQAARLISSTRKDLGVTKKWPAWTAQDDASRWLSLVTAWLNDHHGPTPRPGSDRKLKALGYDWDQRSEAARHRLVRVLHTYRGHCGTPEQWLRAWHVRFPEQRLQARDGRGHLVDTELRADLLHEAELLGLLAAGAPTPLLVALHDAADVGPVLAGMDDVGETTIRAQADLTLICTGRPSRAMRQALDRFADVESSAQATIWRVSEVSLGRAYSAGDTPDEVLAVLSGYADPVPQPMAYLVKDAHRRFAPVTVGAATSFVLADDAQLQDALARRGKAAKTIKLVRVAPGVAVSQGSPEATVAALRELGLHADRTAVAPRRTAVVEAPVRRAKGVPVFDLSEQARAAAERLR